jgi:hypothetical protein
MDETDDDVLWNGSEEDVYVMDVCLEDEAIGCEDGDTHTNF